MAIQPDEDTSSVAREFGANDWLIEEMYEKYSQDPESVDPSWAEFFRQQDANGSAPAVPPTAAAKASSTTPEFVPAPKSAGSAATENGAAPTTQPSDKASHDAATGSQPVAAATKGTAAATSDTTAAATNDTSGSSTNGTDAAATTAVTTAVPTGDLAIEEEPRPAHLHPTVVPNRAPDLARERESYLPSEAPSYAKRPAPSDAEATAIPLRGTPLRTAKNMDMSLEVPTATSVRTVPMKLVIELRNMINQHLKRTIGGKVSFTHIIGYAMVQALRQIPAMNHAYRVAEGKPTMIEPGVINLGLAIDVPKEDGTRQLVVPNIPGCEELTFGQFWYAYDQVVRKARANELTLEDYKNTTCTLTNPGGLGTNHSIPRLMPGQGLILGVGSIDYAPGFLGASPERLNELGVSKVMSLTSTYDHRVIQGAQSGEFLAILEKLLLGGSDFYEGIFTSLRIPYAPLQWDTDIYVQRPEAVDKQARVLELINSYRTLGHLIADIDPLTYRPRTHPDLELGSHGLTIWDLERSFPVGNLSGQRRGRLPLRETLEVLNDAYCRTVGVEYMHITNPVQREWLQDRLERAPEPIGHAEHLRILDRLSESEIFETFLQTKFVGQKRFSLEGGESTMVSLDEICQQAADIELDEVTIGMPHRGRLNVLANIVGKSYSQIFREFEGRMDPESSQGSGDVKYHLGAEGSFESINGNTIRTSVAANPSHLEAVNPVLEGIARAKQDRSTNDDPYPVLPILLHGDAAFAGQGIVYETLQMSQLKAYRTGGTIHIIVNNQVGFTTAPLDSRSSVYCTDVAKVVEAPVFHVNGDDPDAVVRVSRLAFEFRQEFHKDVVIDIVCYRRRGHNEGDDPSFTQPLMYDLVEQKRSTRKVYTDSLIGRGDISTEDVDNVASRFRTRLETVFKEVRSMADKPEAVEEYHKVPSYPAKVARGAQTAISADTMDKIAAAMTRFPDDFTVHPKVLPQLEQRAEMIRQGPMNWGAAEALAFGSLVLEGRPVRLAGQDSRRGTFSQRFAAIVDRNTNERYVPLAHISEDQARFAVYDSLLSEYGGLGFEYGYSVAAPETLVLWEAQFGDFANGAQTIADEFISSAAAKWTQKSGVVLLLPHGYEGQGPDHSSARIERWLQLASEDNMAVCQPSTPASYFHLLRQHANVNWHRPVVIMTPKSMLRSKLAVSMPSDITNGSWQAALDDPTISDASGVKRLVLCSGKVRWELVAMREKLGLEGKVAIIGLERLYPLPTNKLAGILQRYQHVTDIRFAQDEPLNQGAWWFMELHLPPAIAKVLPGYELKMTPFTRPAAAAPSVGSHHLHAEQEDTLVKAALGDLEG